MLFFIIIPSVFCVPDPRYRANNSMVSEPSNQKQSFQSKIYERGIASYMGKELNGRKTANGESYNMWAMAAAHKKLPFGTIVQVKNLKNNKTVNVRINDRGPFVKGRVIDVTFAAAQKLDFVNDGLAQVELYIIQPVQ